MYKTEDYLFLYCGNKHGKTYEAALRLVTLANEINGRPINVRVTSVEYDKVVAENKKLQEIARIAASLLDYHPEIIGESCHLCEEVWHTTHGEKLQILVEDYYNYSKGSDND